MRPIPWHDLGMEDVSGSPETLAACLVAVAEFDMEGKSRPRVRDAAGAIDLWEGKRQKE